MDKRYKELFGSYLKSLKGFIAIYYDSKFEVIDRHDTPFVVNGYKYDGRVYVVYITYKGLDLITLINPVDIVIYLMDLIEEKK